MTFVRVLSILVGAEREHHTAGVVVVSLCPLHGVVTIFYLLALLCAKEVFPAQPMMGKRNVRTSELLLLERFGFRLIAPGCIPAFAVVVAAFLAKATG